MCSFLEVDARDARQGGCTKKHRERSMSISNLRYRIQVSSGMMSLTYEG